MNYSDFIAPHEIENEIPNEYLFERIRNWRDAELKASDWTQLPDAPCDQIAWRKYRQALRELPAQNHDATQLVFPKRPE